MGDADTTSTGPQAATAVTTDAHGHGHGHDHGHENGHGAPVHRGVRQEKLPPADEAVEVAPGVLCVQLTIAMPGLGHVNCYVMEDERGLTLVDPGLPGRKPWEELVQRLRRAGLDIARVHTVIVTHSHPDHFGAAGHIRRLTGAEVITHADFKTFYDPNEEDDEHKELADPRDLDTWAAARERVAKARAWLHGAAGERGRDVVEGVGNQLRQWRRWNGPTPWGGPHPRPPRKMQLSYAVNQLSGGAYFRPPKPSARVVDGQILPSAVASGWRCTPPVTRWTTCACSIRRRGRSSPATTCCPPSRRIRAWCAADPLKLYFDSLERMVDLHDIRTVLPAHGLPFDNLAERCRDIQAHHHERLELLRTAGADLGLATVEEYSQRLFDPSPGARWPIRDLRPPGAPGPGRPGGAQRGARPAVALPAGGLTARDGGSRTATATHRRGPSNTHIRSPMVTSAGSASSSMASWCSSSKRPPRSLRAGRACSTMAQATALLTWPMMSRSVRRTGNRWRWAPSPGGTVGAAGPGASGPGAAAAGASSPSTSFERTRRPPVEGPYTARKPSSSRVGRPRWGSSCTHNDAASTRPPPAPRIAVRRSAHEAPMPEHQVRSDTSSRSDGQRRTSITVRRTTQAPGLAMPLS
ncbi:MAG: MBL fold metallo-hydrolase [Acidimicrobiales bacterium]